MQIWGSKHEVERDPKWTEEKCHDGIVELSSMTTPSRATTALGVQAGGDDQAMTRGMFRMRTRQKPFTTHTLHGSDEKLTSVELSFIR
jgi:hypothetical protein